MNRKNLLHAFSCIPVICEWLCGLVKYGEHPSPNLYQATVIAFLFILLVYFEVFNAAWHIYNSYDSLRVCFVANTFLS